ncbi:hypothetical protein [Nocardia sp. NPDC051570]|uniref:hypothetical protein n=1 Tax=Nocardia sp. NPDC051570 TaxID=3364324 RepID=UPI0037930F09
MALLRRMVEWSGRSRGQITTISGLPRSTVYRYTSAKNSALPKNLTSSRRAVSSDRRKT